MKKLNQNGSHVVVLLIGVVVVALVGFAGYRVAHKNTALQTSTSNSTTGTTTATVPSKITNHAGLTQAAQALDSANANINNDVNGSSLNADLNSLL